MLEQGPVATGTLICWESNGDHLFQELWLPVLHTAFGRLRETLADEAEDIAIQAIDIAARREPPIGNLEELKRVAMGVAKNLAVSRLREFFATKRGAVLTVSLDAPGGEPLSASLVHDGAVAHVDRAHLQELLGWLQDRLTPRMRLVVEEHYHEGLTQVEIAAKHGIPLGTVAVTMKRAMTVLRREALTGPHAEPMLEHL